MNNFRQIPKGNPRCRSKKPTPSQSLRQSAFLYFDFGFRPMEVARFLRTDPSTIFRYYQQWKKLPRGFQITYPVVRKCFSQLGWTGRRRIAAILAKELGTSTLEVAAQLEKPWGVKKLVSGEWRQWPVCVMHPPKEGHINEILGRRLVFGLSDEVRFILMAAASRGAELTDLPENTNRYFV